MFARDGVNVPKGNRELLKFGAAPLPEAELDSIDDLAEWMRIHAKASRSQLELLG